MSDFNPEEFFKKLDARVAKIVDERMKQNQAKPQGHQLHQSEQRLDWNCPECEADLKKAIAEKYPNYCEECGELVKKEGIEEGYGDCPTCGAYGTVRPRSPR